MQTSVLRNYFKLKTTLRIISWKFLGLKLRYISQKFKGSLLRFSSGSNLFMTGWTLNWTLGSVQQKFWTLNWTLSSVQEVQVQTLVFTHPTTVVTVTTWTRSHGTQAHQVPLPSHEGCGPVDVGGGTTRETQQMEGSCGASMKPMMKIVGCFVHSLISHPK